MKFEWDRQEIAVYSNENLCAFNDTSVPFIEAEEDKGPWVYQVSKTVSVEKVLEGEYISGPKLASAIVMVAIEMLKNSFMPDKGLGASLQGIVQLVSLHENLGTFGLGFKPMEDDVKKARKLKKKSLFDEVNMVEIGEGFSKADVKFIGSKVKLNNWDATHLPIRKEFCSLLYPTWLANVVPVSKDGKTSVCVDYHDLNKASPKDNFPLPNIHILIDNYAKHEIGSFVDYYAGYHQILMDEEDAEKTAFITPWGTYFYWIMPFGLKNTGATYMREMTIVFHDMIHKEIEVYVDDVIVKSKKQADHVADLRKFFQSLHRYNLKLNPAKCAFGVPSGKLLGFIVSRRGIELHPSIIKVIQELPPPRNKTKVMSLLERLNYISRFIAQLTTTCEPMFKLLKKDDAVKWIDECQEAFDKIKGKEQAIYYLIKKFTSYEVEYTPLERTCYALTWVAQKLKHYLSSYTTYFISYLDPFKYIFQKPMPIGRLAKWQILLTEFDIIYVTRTAMKAQALADHLAENPVDTKYEPLRTYFLNEEVMHIDEVEQDDKPVWKLFFDGAANMKGVGIGVLLISEILPYFYCTNNMAEYEACILGMRLAVDMGVQEVLVLGYSDLLVHQIQGEWDTRDLKLIPYRQCATPYLLVYGTKAIIPAEVEIPSLRIVAKAKIEDDEWVKTRLEQLNLIDEKRLEAMCHGQLYKKRMARAYNKKGQEISFVPKEPSVRKACTEQIPNWDRNVSLFCLLCSN
ncbi:uncharacterized protein [Nicotiana sylvestris]|uniref:uncharacterized protein n=1 Tax=Nicotiana sylvestris TaxID=4096 RepID=UPI00388CC430